MLTVQDADHLLLFDDERGSRRNRCRGPYADRLTGEATFAEKIARCQDRYHRFLAGFIYDGEPHASRLDVQHIVGGIALREDGFLFPKSHRPPEPVPPNREKLGDRKQASAWILFWI